VGEGAAGGQHFGRADKVSRVMPHMRANVIENGISHNTHATRDN